MQSLITPAAMKAMEQRYFTETGTPSIDLMERAARALCDSLLRRFGNHETVAFACGPGGNGGDGYACARMYAQMGGGALIVSAGAPRTPDAIENLNRARAAGVPELTLEAISEAPGVWVDALYGTGLSRAPEGLAAELIERMNRDRAGGGRTVAVDIPSGLNGATGAAFRPCVRADVTVTFQFAKVGHWLGDGLDATGELEVADIGIPAGFFPGDLAGLVENADVRAFLPRRPRNLHKGQNGHLLIVAGSFGMAGAAAMCARAALRGGAGLVTVACPESIVPMLQTLAPCAMCVPLPEADGAISPGAADALAAALPGKDAVACGCGLSRRAAPEVLRLLLDSGLPTVFDADALNLISEQPDLKRRLNARHLITPHPGEAARLLGWRATDPIADAFALRELGCAALLKGAATVVPVGERALISASGGCGMAKGGSGDCLTGIVGALMAEAAAHGTALSGGTLARCAAVASEIHGRAGELAQAKYGARGMCATDLIDALPAALLSYE